MAKFIRKKEKDAHKQVKHQKSPRNYRIIPEKLNTDEAVFFVGVFCILLAILVVSFDLYSNFNKQKKLASEKFKVLREVAFWQSDLKIHTNYRDGYFSLALLEYQLKDFKGASENIEKVLILDPNFEKGRELQKLLR